MAVWGAVFFILAGGFHAPWLFIFRLLPVLIGVGLVVFLNEALLLPRLYFGRGRGCYILGGLLLLVGVALLLQYGFEPNRRFPVEFGRGPRPRGLGTATVRYLLPLATSLLGSSLLAVTKYASDQQQRIIRADAERLATELKFLKSQVNPHFLFNSLNNIYTLTLLRDELAAESLLRLSDMLRYMLYEADTPTVALSKEIGYIRNFVELMALRDSRGLNVRVDLDESRPGLRIAPLLLIPFVENAFKHGGIEDRRRGFVDLQLKTSDGGLDFVVTNSLPGKPATVDAVGGIGLGNVRKRLELLYPDRHALAIDRAPTTFSVTLSLHLP